MSPVLRRTSDGKLASALRYLNWRETHGGLDTRQRLIRSWIVREMQTRERKRRRTSSTH